MEEKRKRGVSTETRRNENRKEEPLSRASGSGPRKMKKLAETKKRKRSTERAEVDPEKEKSYLVSPKILDCASNYKEGKRITELFELAPKSVNLSGICGNIGWYLVVDQEKKQVKMSDDDSGLMLGEAIPSCLALYRLLCSFPNSFHSIERWRENSLEAYLGAQTFQNASYLLRL